MILDILKSNFNKIVLITAIYVLISWFIVVYNHVLLFSYYSLGPAELYSLSTFFIVNTLIGLIAGILGGSLLVVINSRLFRKKSFGYAMIATFISYTAIFVIIVIVVPFAS